MIEAIIRMRLAGLKPNMVFIEFDGQPDDYPPYPVVVYKPDEITRVNLLWAKDLSVMITGDNTDAVDVLYKRLLPIAARVIANYTITKPITIRDSKDIL